MDFSCSRLARHNAERKATNSALVCREAVFPITSPDRVLSAAYNERVPWR